MTTDLASGADARTKIEKKKQKQKQKREERSRETERERERPQERKRKRKRFFLVALSSGCRVILPYYYSLLMPSGIVTERKERVATTRMKRKRGR